MATPRCRSLRAQRSNAAKIKEIATEQPASLNTLSNDTFSIDGGPAQTYDGLAVYNATITYTDGTPDASITAVVIQDTAGNAPWTVLAN